MANNIFSYTNRDYEGSRKEGLSQIPRLSNGVWTDLNASDPGIIILDYVHALVDMINYYQDHQALESFITTAKERANIFRLAKQLSYKIQSAKSARVEVTFHSDVYYNHPIRIPKYTRLFTRDGVEFVTTKDVYLPANESEVSVLCRQGVLYEQVYQGTGYSRFSEAPNNYNQSINLTANYVDTEFISIVDSIGRIWTPVDFVVFSTELDRVYQTELNPDNTVTISFGDGERGVVPKETDELTIKYLVTRAEQGRVGANSIINTEPIYDDNGAYVDFTVSNKEASIGGYAPQSSRSIRELAPGAIKAQDRAITLSDFENLAKLVEGVLDAKASDINTDPDMPFHEVKVIIIPELSHSTNRLLVDEVYKYLYERMIPPTTLNVTLPSDIFLDVEISVKKLANTDNDILRGEIESLIKEYFEDRASIIGENFYPTDLSTKISSLANVKYIMSISPNDIIEVEDSSRVMLGNLNIHIE